jgi:hypothetical protein
MSKLTFIFTLCFIWSTLAQSSPVTFMNVRSFCEQKENVQLPLCQKISRLQSKINQTTENKSPKRLEEGCDGLNVHLPQSTDPIKYIPVRFLFPINDNAATRSKSGQPLMPLNFTADHDGLGDRTTKAEDVAREIVRLVNEKLAQNKAQQNVGLFPGSFKIYPNPIRLIYKGIDFIPDSRNFGRLENFNGWFKRGHSHRANWLPAFSANELNLIVANTYGQYLVIGEAKLDSQGRPIISAQGYQPKVFTHALPNIMAETAMMLPDPTVAPAIQTANIWTAWHLKQPYWPDPSAPGGIFQGPIPISASIPSILGALASTLGLTSVTELNRTVKIRTSPDAPLTDYICTDYPNLEGKSYCGKSALNNIMSNNCSRDAWSACQLRVAHFNLTHALDRMLYLPCRLGGDSSYDTVIPANTHVVWSAPHHLPGKLILEKGARLTIGCGTTMAQDAQIIGDSRRIQGIGNISRRVCNGSSPGSTGGMSGGSITGGGTSTGGVSIEL